MVSLILPTLGAFSWQAKIEHPSQKLICRFYADLLGLNGIASESNN
jgi:hypothetical protein